MATPFVIPPYPYTPKWMGNRKRLAEEQFRVLLAPVSYSRLQELSTQIHAMQTSGTTPDLFPTVLFLKESVMEIQNLSVNVCGKLMEIKDVEALLKLPGALELVTELMGRAQTGTPDEEEEKNSESPSGV